MALKLDKATTSANMIKNIATKSSEENLKRTVKNIDVNLIDFNIDNDKIFNVDNLDSLISSIKRNGFEGSIEVYSKKDGRYEIISGHRRYLANKAIGNLTIPCEVKEEPTAIEKADLLIISNITSRQLTPIEKGRAIVYYKENVLKPGGFKGNVREEIAKRFGYSSSNVHKYEALTKLTKELQDLVEAGYPFAQMSAASSLSDADQRILYDMLMEYSETFPEVMISGTRIEDYINKIKAKKEKEQAKKSQKENNIIGLEEVVSSQLKTIEKNEKEYISSEVFNVDNEEQLPVENEFSPQVQPDYVYYADNELESSVERLVELLSQDYKFKDKDKIREQLKILEKSIKNFK